MNNRRTKLTVLAASWAALAMGPGGLWGQATDPAASAADTRENAGDDSEVVELSPFTIDASRDSGYRATNSISGTRLNTPIKDIPLSLEVITSEFMRDTGATNLREALRYSPGVVLQSQFDGLSGALTSVDSPDNAQANNPESATRNANSSTIKLRGFITDQSLRDGFRRQEATDTVNISRVEILRGPSALLYGVGNFGGVVNYLPKRPGEEPSYHGAVSIGSDSFYRTEFEASLGTFYREGEASLGFMVTGAWQSNEDFTDFYKHEHWFISPVFVVKPFENTTITLDTEFGWSRDDGIGFQNVRSSVLTSGFPYQTNARRVDFFTPPGVDPRTFRWSGPDTRRRSPSRNYIVDLQQKFSENLWLKAGVDLSRINFDSRNIWYGTFSSLDPFNRDEDGNPTTVNGGNVQPAQLPRYYRAPRNAAETQYLADLATALDNTRPGFSDTDWVPVFNNRPSDFWLGDIYGAPFTSTSLLDSQGDDVTTYHTVLNYQWSDYTRAEERKQVRVELNYSYDGLFGQHDFLLGMQYMGTEVETNNFGQSPDLSVGAPQNSDPVVWNYHSPLDPTPIRRDVQGDGITPTVASRPVSWSLAQGWDLGYYLVYHGQFWNDRINVIGGLRWDRNDSRSHNRRLWLPDAPLEITDRANPDNPYGVQPDAPTEVSPQFGLSFAVTPNISVYGVYSSGLLPNPPGTLDGNGVQFDPVTAKNHEYGIKFELMDGRISGSVAAFKIKRQNIPRNIWWAPAPGVPAALSGHVQNYDASQPTTIGFFDWGQLKPYMAWYASKSELAGSTPWATIYPAMYDILKLVPVDPSRTWGGAPLPLGALDPDAGPGSQAYDANGNPIAGKTVGDLWTEYAQSHGVTLPAVPSDPNANPFMNTGASNPWQAAWVNTYGLMVSDKTKNEVAAQELYDIFWTLNANSLQAALGPDGRDPNAEVFGWGGHIPWLWAGDGAKLPYYPGYWNDPNAQAGPGDAGPHTGTMNSILGMNSARVPFQDESKGFEVQLNLVPVRNWQVVLGYSHLENKNTTMTLPYVAVNDPTGNTRYGIWAAPGEAWGTTYFTREQAYDNPDDPTTYHVAPNDYGLSLDDSPEDTVTMWTKYRFTTGVLAGLGIGGGGAWESRRLFDASVSVDGTVSGDLDPETLRIVADQLYTSSRLRLSALVDYEWTIADRYRTRVALNVDNLLNDKDRYGYIFAPGRSWKVTASVDF